MNKFEHVFNDHHQMSLAWGGGFPNEHVWKSLQWSSQDGGSQFWWIGLRSDVHGGTLPCDLSHDGFDVTYPLLPWTEKQLRKHYFPTTSGRSMWNGMKITWLKQQFHLNHMLYAIFSFCNFGFSVKKISRDQSREIDMTLFINSFNNVVQKLFEIKSKNELKCGKYFQRYSSQNSSFL